MFSNKTFYHYIIKINILYFLKLIFEYKTTYLGCFNQLSSGISENFSSSKKTFLCIIIVLSFCISFDTIYKKRCSLEHGMVIIFEHRFYINMILKDIQIPSGIFKNVETSRFLKQTSPEPESLLVEPSRQHFPCC